MIHDTAEGQAEAALSNAQHRNAQDPPRVTAGLQKQRCRRRAGAGGRGGFSVGACAWPWQRTSRHVCPAVYSHSRGRASGLEGSLPGALPHRPQNSTPPQGSLPNSSAVFLKQKTSVRWVLGAWSSAPIRSQLSLLRQCGSDERRMQGGAGVGWAGSHACRGGGTRWGAGQQRSPPAPGRQRQDGCPGLVGPPVQRGAANVSNAAAAVALQGGVAAGSARRCGEAAAPLDPQPALPPLFACQ